MTGPAQARCDVAVIGAGMAGMAAALFAAVAQVLAYVYQLRAALAGSGAMPAELPALPVPDELDPQHGAAAQGAEA